MSDPPRLRVAAAIARAHQAGIRVHVVTGTELDRLSEPELDQLPASAGEVVFA
ncbi:hypothetical protein OG496_03565 [Streptomyces sp. NBC_00988]|uniref:hypothetical protein n=1 Tax=Streptomyces sp. NBC_00988 TaxID=2903704 RepID=UPI00386CB4C7|nr:hypothetical protein OG496_03565 [Streptomyces sp. NBC_00988]